jgi:hypothetical protein
MKKKLVFLAVLVYILALGFVLMGCPSSSPATTEEVSYVLTLDGFKAEINGTALKFTLSDPADESLTVNGLTNVTEGLKVLRDAPSDSTFELVYLLNGTENTFDLYYANQSGSITRGSRTVTFSEGKGWYMDGPDHGKLLTPANNYSPYSNQNHWVVRRKDNKKVVWEQ